MGERIREIPAAFQGRVGQEARRVNHPHVAALVLLAAGVLMGQGVLWRTVRAAERPESVTVQRDGVPVYTQMATTSLVVMRLMRGDVVEVDPVGTTPEGKWCRVRESAVWGRSGYVRCEELELEGSVAVASPVVPGPPAGEVPTGETRPPDPPRSMQAPAPKPATEATAPAVTPETAYAVAVASLVNEQNALALKARLVKLGYTPVIHQVTAPITHHRVLVGEFDSRQEGEKTAGRLKTDGFSSTLVDAERGKFRLEVGSYLNLNEALDVVSDLQKKNYTLKVVSHTTPTLVHQVRVGGYPNRDEAFKALDGLKKQGFTPLVVKE